jgi:hypothetical protein
MMFENWVLRRILGPKRDEMVGIRRILHNELHNLYSSRSIIRMIKSRMILVRNVARRRKRGKHIRLWWESQKGNLDVRGKIILK